MNSTIIVILTITALVCSGLALSLALGIRKTFLRLTAGNNTKNLNELLSELLEHLEKSNRNREHLQDLIARHEAAGRSHLCYVGLVRFNPFPDAGSDQSFTLAVLDGQKNGFVISSLHARDKTRIFAKPVVSGKEGTHQFSNEERLAVSRALET